MEKDKKSTTKKIGIRKEEIKKKREQGDQEIRDELLEKLWTVKK